MVGMLSRQQKWNNQIQRRRDKMTKEEVANWAISRGWKKGTRPSKRLLFYKDVHGGPFRLTISNLSVRYEVRISGRWIRLRSGYLKNLSITEDGKLSGLKR